jgi:hypothetical protein
MIISLDMGGTFVPMPALALVNTNENTSSKNPAFIFRNTLIFLSVGHNILQIIDFIQVNGWVNPLSQDRTGQVNDGGLALR